MLGAGGRFSSMARKLSAEGQLEHPSEVNSSTITGVRGWAAAQAANRPINPRNRSIARTFLLTLKYKVLYTNRNDTTYPRRCLHLRMHIRSMDGARHYGL